MRKVMISCAVLMFFASCSQSPEDKANVLIKESMKKTLYHAETYDPVETVVDSAFTPFDDPAFYKKRLSYANLAWKLTNTSVRQKMRKEKLPTIKICSR